MVEGHPNIKMANSIIDYVFRSLGMEYLGRTDLVQVPPSEVGELPEPPSGLAVDAGVQLGLDDDLPIAARTAPISHPAVANAVVNSNNGDHAGNGHASTIPVASVAATAKRATAAITQTASVNAALSDMMCDAPLYHTYGHITVRNGSRYRWLNCGKPLGGS